MKTQLPILILAVGTIALLFKNKTAKVGAIAPAPSPIHGTGLFTSQFIPAGTRLFKTLTRQPNTIMTYYGTLINHCNKANTQIINHGNEWWQHAIKNITPGEEITADYRTAPPFLSRDTSTFT